MLSDNPRTLRKETTMAGFGGWLYPERTSGSGDDDRNLDPEARAKENVQVAACGLKEPLLPYAVEIFNAVCDRSSGMADELLGATEKFVENFQRNQVSLNQGVDSLDFVRECVRRSFGISEVVPFDVGPRKKMQWVTDEQIEHIALSLVELGFKLLPNHNHGT